MTPEEIREAYLDEETLEYHVMGNETDLYGLLPAPGWYPCTIDDICADGNVEIELTTRGIGVTVLSKNIPIAFRRKQEVVS